MKVLVADDDSVSLALCKKVISKWGYEVETANDGFEAWSSLSKHDNAPKLAILDWEMPGMQGIELCNVIKKKMNVIGFVYIIILTAREEPDDIIAGLDAGADAYLIKPIDQFELKSRLAVGARNIEFQNKIMEKYHQLHNDLDHIHVKQSQDIPFHSDQQNLITALDQQMKSQLQSVFKDLNFLQAKLLSFNIDKQEKGNLVSLVSSINSNLTALNQLLDTSAKDKSID